MTTKSVVKKAAKPLKVDFEFYAPEAKSVFLVGSFNNWNEKAQPLKKLNDGIWSTSVTLSPGRYEYRFLVDGTWQGDQKPVETVPNNFGSWNCVKNIS